MARVESLINGSPLRRFAAGQCRFRARSGVRRLGWLASIPASDVSDEESPLRDRLSLGGAGLARPDQLVRRAPDEGVERPGHPRKPVRCEELFLDNYLTVERPHDPPELPGQRPVCCGLAGEK